MKVNLAMNIPAASMTTPAMTESFVRRCRGARSGSVPAAINQSMPAATPTVKTRGYEILVAPYDDGNDTIGADRISISW
jgi:hypothetical protein